LEKQEVVGNYAFKKGWGEKKEWGAKSGREGYETGYSNKRGEKKKEEGKNRGRGGMREPCPTIGTKRRRKLANEKGGSLYSSGGSREKRGTRMKGRKGQQAPGLEENQALDHGSN